MDEESSIHNEKDPSPSEGENDSVKEALSDIKQDTAASISIDVKSEFEVQTMPVSYDAVVNTSCDSIFTTPCDSMVNMCSSTTFDSTNTLESIGEKDEEKKSYNVDMITENLKVNDIPASSAYSGLSDEEIYNSMDSETKISESVDDFQQESHDNSYCTNVKTDEIVLSDSDPEYNCKVCGDFYQDPRILPCLHNFCHSCIQKLNIYSTKAGKTYIVCPVCKEEATVNIAEECCFKVNHFVANRVELAHAKEREGDCIICKVRGETSPACGLCLDCKDMLCKDCCEKHTFSRVTINHRIISTDELATGKYEKDLKEQQEMFCPIHNQEHMKFYCSECSVGVCRDCILLHHQNHTCLTSEEAAEKTQRELDSLLYGIKDKQKDIMKNDIQGFDEKMKSLELMEQTEIEKINNIIDVIMKLLKKEKQNFLNKIKHEFDIARNTCYMRRSLSEKNFCKMEEVSVTAKKLLQDGKPTEITCLADVIRHRAVSELNMYISPDPVSWFKPPYVQAIKSPSQLDQISFPLFKLITAEKIYDPIKNMQCDATYDEWLEEKGLKSLTQVAGEAKGNNVSMQLVADVSFVARDTSSPDSKGAKPKTKQQKTQQKSQKEQSPAPKNSSTEQGKTKQKASKKAVAQQGKTEQKIAKKEQKKAKALITVNPENLSYFYGAPTIASQYPAFNSLGASNFPIAAFNSLGPIAGQRDIAMIEGELQFDARMEGEMKIPNLTGVCAKYNRFVLVSDSNNNNVKIFTTKGVLKEVIDAVVPTSVAVLPGGATGWSSESSVLVQPSDKSFCGKLNFQNSGVIPHPISWYPDGQIIVGNGNVIRRYKIDKENKHLKKIDTFGPKDINGQPLSNIFNLKGYKDGRIAVVDWDIKAIVIIDADKNCTGQFPKSSDEVSMMDGSWLPGGVCFDNVRGNVFATDYYGNRLLLLHGVTGELLQEWNTLPNISKPWGVACNGEGLLFVTGSTTFVHVYRYSYIAG